MTHGFELDAKLETVKLVTSEDRTVADPSYTQVKLIVERRTEKSEDASFLDIKLRKSFAYTEQTTTV
jgi:hypothetical protein